MTKINFYTSKIENTLEQKLLEGKKVDFKRTCDKALTFHVDIFSRNTQGSRI